MEHDEAAEAGSGSRLRSLVQELTQELAKDEHSAEDIDLARKALLQWEPRVRELQRSARSGPSTRERVCALAEAGKTDAEIAAELGVRRDYVTRLRTQERLPPGSGRTLKQRDWRATVLGLLKAGRSTPEIAEEMGWNLRTAQTRVSEVRRDARQQGEQSEES